MDKVLASGDQIGQARQRLDELDGEILRLVKERVSFSGLVQEARIAQGGCRTDSRRENAVVARYREGLGSPGRDIALSLLRLCRGADPTPSVRGRRVALRRAFLGPAESVSHQAAQLLGRHAEGELLPLGTLDAVMRCLADRQADEAVLPLENCVSGPAMQVLGALAVTDEVRMVGQLWLPVEWVLAAAPGTALAQVSAVGSHPHALTQTRGWLASVLPGADTVTTASTSAAAATLLTPDSAFEAVVCTRRAAEHYRLQILAAADVEQTPCTRFALVQAGAGQPAPTGNDMTSLVLSIRRAQLTEVLESLAHAQAEVMGLHVLPVARAGCRLWLDCRGHVTDRQMIHALSVLRKQCGHLRVVGSYPAVSADHTAEV